jgi:hypothetical protein
MDNVDLDNTRQSFEMESIDRILLKHFISFVRMFVRNESYRRLI